MTAPDLEVLQALDWSEIQCQCAHHRHACPNRATHVVAIHAIEACNQPGLDPFGNRIELRCYACVLRLQAEVGYRLLKLREWGLAACGGCGAPLAEIADVVREVSELW